jgi:hypothetical protein
MLKDSLKEAILDGVIPNDRHAALKFLKEKFKTLTAEVNTDKH